MITALQLRNFQQHKSLTVELSPTVTVISGATARGKSTILRALRWLATNKPNGVEFINWSETWSAVSLLLSSGVRIDRFRGKSKNFYRIDKKPLKAFGTEVPTPVTELLRMDEINFQRQFDSPFWFLDGAPEVARQLNAIVNLSVIDDTLQQIAAVLRKAKLTVEVSKDRLSSAREREKALAYVSEFERDVAACEEIAVKLAQLDTQAAELAELVRETTALKRATRSELVDISDADTLYTEWYQTQIDLQSLKACFTEGTHLIWEYDDAFKFAEETENELKKRFGDKCPLCGQIIACSHTCH